MKKNLLVFLSALLLLSCKKDKSDVGPVPFTLLTRQVVFQSNTTYTFKGSIVGESVIQVRECGFMYTTSATTSGSLPIDYYSPNTTKIPVYKDAAVNPGNFEAQVLLVSKQFYNVTTYAIIHNSSSQQDAIYTGSQLYFQTQ